MGDRRPTDDEREAIGHEAGVPWQRVCPDCGHQPADVQVECAGTPAVTDDPWLRCPACGQSWPAPGVRYVTAALPPVDGPEADAFLEQFIAALQGGAGRTGRPERR